MSVIGKITAVDPTATGWVICGTDTGHIFMTQLGATITPSSTRLCDGPITALKIYRSHAFVAWSGAAGSGLAIWEIRDDNTLGTSPKYKQTLQGPGVAQATWIQSVFTGVQVGARGSMLSAASVGPISDAYELVGGFVIDSIIAYGGNLIYAGHRPNRDGVVYTFRELLSERFLDPARPEIDAMMPLAHLLLVARPSLGGLWWLDPRGGGPFAQYDAATGNRIRSIAHFGGDVYYTLDTVGVIRVNTSAYRTQGTLNSGWFHGGFPELMKDWADISLQLEEPLATGQTVTIRVRKEGESGFTLVGSLTTVGQTSMRVAIPATHQQSARLEIQLQLDSGGTNTPIVTSVITRYRVLPIQKRGWAFTVRAERGLLFGDGTRESRDPETIVSDLFALQTLGQIDFQTMLEPTVRKVYVTNVQLTSQLVGQKLTQKDEGFVAVEVIEV